MSVDPSSPAVQAFFQMASQALGGLGTHAVRWDGSGQSRQIVEARLFLDRDQIQLAWDAPHGREQAVVRPEDLLHMVQGSGPRVRWFVVEGFKSLELSETVTLNQWIRTHGCRY